MSDKDDPKSEGHTREWQDRGRVVLDAKKAAHTEASPNQSPESKENRDDAGEKSDGDDNRISKDEDPAY